MSIDPTIMLRHNHKANDTGHTNMRACRRTASRNQQASRIDCNPREHTATHKAYRRIKGEASPAPNLFLLVPAVIIVSFCLISIFWPIFKTRFVFMVSNGFFHLFRKRVTFELELLQSRKVVDAEERCGR